MSVKARELNPIALSYLSSASQSDRESFFLTYYISQVLRAMYGIPGMSRVIGRRKIK